MLAIALGLVACGSDTGNDPTSVADVLAEPDQVALSYTVSGGIAGDTVAELIVFGDGTGTALRPDDSTQDVFVGRSVLNGVISDIEDLGVHEIDLDEHPDTRIADGFGTTITVHSINGTSQVGWYGIGEAPDSFDADWRAIDERVGALSALISYPTAPDQAPLGELVAVEGFIVDDGTDLRVCAVATCPDGGIAVLDGGNRPTGLDPATEWILVGTVTEAGIDLE